MSDKFALFRGIMPSLFPSEQRTQLFGLGSLGATLKRMEGEADEDGDEEESAPSNKGSSRRSRSSASERAARRAEVEVMSAAYRYADMALPKPAWEPTNRYDVDLAVKKDVTVPEGWPRDLDWFSDHAEALFSQVSKAQGGLGLHLQPSSTGFVNELARVTGLHINPLNLANLELSPPFVSRLTGNERKAAAAARAKLEKKVVDFDLVHVQRTDEMTDEQYKVLIAAERVRMANDVNTRRRQITALLADPTEVKTVFLHGSAAPATIYDANEEQITALSQNWNLQGAERDVNQTRAQIRTMLSMTPDENAVLDKADEERAAQLLLDLEDSRKAWLVGRLINRFLDPTSADEFTAAQRAGKASIPAELIRQIRASALMRLVYGQPQLVRHLLSIARRPLRGAGAAKEMLHELVLSTLLEATTVRTAEEIDQLSAAERARNALAVTQIMKAKDGSSVETIVKLPSGTAILTHLGSAKAFALTASGESAKSPAYAGSPSLQRAAQIRTYALLMLELLNTKLQRLTALHAHSEHKRTTREQSAYAMQMDEGGELVEVDATDDAAMSEANKYTDPGIQVPALTSPKLEQSIRRIVLKLSRAKIMDKAGEELFKARIESIADAIKKLDVKNSVSLRFFQNIEQEIGSGHYEKVDPFIDPVSHKYTKALRSEKGKNFFKTAIQKMEAEFTALGLPMPQAGWDAERVRKLYEARDQRRPELYAKYITAAETTFESRFLCELGNEALRPKIEAVEKRLTEQRMFFIPSFDPFKNPVHRAIRDYFAMAYIVLPRQNNKVSQSVGYHELFWRHQLTSNGDRPLPPPRQELVRHFAVWCRNEGLTEMDPCKRALGSRILIENIDLKAQLGEATAEELKKRAELITQTKADWASAERSYTKAFRSGIAEDVNRVVGACLVAQLEYEKTGKLPAEIKIGEMLSSIQEQIADVVLKELMSHSEHAKEYATRSEQLLDFVTNRIIEFEKQTTGSTIDPDEPASEEEVAVLSTPSVKEWEARRRFADRADIMNARLLTREVDDRSILERVRLDAELRGDARMLRNMPEPERRARLEAIEQRGHWISALATARLAVDKQGKYVGLDRYALNAAARVELMEEIFGRRDWSAYEGAESKGTGRALIRPSFFPQSTPKRILTQPLLGIRSVSQLAGAGLLRVFRRQ